MNFNKIPPFFLVEQSTKEERDKALSYIQEVQEYIKSVEKSTKNEVYLTLDDLYIAFLNGVIAAKNIKYNENNKPRSTYNKVKYKGYT